jgi:hypothetical protein
VTASRCRRSFVEGLCAATGQFDDVCVAMATRRSRHHGS